MSRFIKDKFVEYSFHSDYDCAVFGTRFVAFRNLQGEYVLPEEDREALDNIFYFYKKYFCTREIVRVLKSEEEMTTVRSDDPEVLLQIIGLPDVLWQSLDLSKSLLSQIKFEKGLNILKRQYYLHITNESDYWFDSDLTLYSIKNGLYFIYNYLDSFLTDGGEKFPVYFWEEKCPPYLKKLIQEGTSDRLLIDFSIYDLPSEAIEVFKQLDVFSFQDRVNYFINGLDDPRIDAIDWKDLSHKRAYKTLLIGYVYAIALLVFDHYQEEVLNIQSFTKSYLYITRSELSEKDIAVDSGFFADMYSFDDETFFFAACDKDAILKRAKKGMEQNLNTLNLYAYLRIPYRGYAYVKDKNFEDPESFVDALPFSDEFDEEIVFLSSKRDKNFSTYTAGTSLQKGIFWKRLLYKNGLSVLEDDPKNRLDKIRYKIEVLGFDDSSCLKKIFDHPEDILWSYLIENFLYPEFLEKMKALNSACDGKALEMFLRKFNEFKKIERALKELCDEKGFDEDDVQTLAPFFLWFIPYLFEEVEADFNARCIREGWDKASSLLNLTNIAPMVYENLPYPYVTRDRFSYAFREHPYSEPYLCSCQKENLIELIKKIEKAYKEAGRYPENNTILRHLPSPQCIIDRIDPTHPIIDQIPFKDHLCHLCNHLYPSHPNYGADYLSYLPYLINCLPEFGLYPTDHLQYMNAKRDFTPEEPLLFLCDREKLHPLLKPYLHFDPLNLVTIFLLLSPREMHSENFLRLLLPLTRLTEEEITSSLTFFQLSEPVMKTLDIDPEIISLLYKYHSLLEFAAAIEFQKGKKTFTPYSPGLNFDYSETLPYPYILLGDRFNAYAKDPSSGEFYFCDCDRYALESLIWRAFDIIRDFPEFKAIWTPWVLSTSGLPYLAIYKFRNFQLTEETLPRLLDQLEYREDICQDCQMNSRSSYMAFFYKNHPYQKDLGFEIYQLGHTLLKEGILLNERKDFSSIQYDPRIEINLHDDEVPQLFEYIVIDSMPENSHLDFFKLKPGELSKHLSDFSKIGDLNPQILAVASGVILDSYAENNEILLNSLIAHKREERSNLDFALNNFTKLHRVHPDQLYAVVETLWKFIVYLHQKFIEQFIRDELR